MKYVISFILGAIFGSFANVLIFRPIAGLKLNEPRFSVCPSCGNRIKWYDNIPILSYIILGGKCRHCKSKISIRYPLIEILYAIVFTTNTIFFPLDISIAINIIFTVSVPAIFIDFKKMLLPDYTWIVILISSLYLNITHFKGNILPDTIGALITLAILFLLKVRYKNGIGEGDIFLFPVVAFLVGFVFMPLLLLISSISGIIFSLLKKNKLIPFGPFILISGYILTIFKYFIFL